MNDDLEEKKWNNVKKTLQIGDEVEGKVVYKTPFGDFIDIGVGFPALLQIVDTVQVTPGIYKEGNYHPIGTGVKAKIIDFREYNKQILVTQKRLIEV